MPPSLRSEQSAMSFIFFFAETAFPSKITCLTEGESCNCRDEFTFVFNFAIPFLNGALLPVSRSRTIKYRDSSSHLFTKAISALISLFELNNQEKKPSDCACVARVKKTIVTMFRNLDFRHY